MLTVTKFANKVGLTRQRVLQLIQAGSIKPKPKKQEHSGLYLIAEGAVIEKYNLPRGKRSA